MNAFAKALNMTATASPVASPAPAKPAKPDLSALGEKAMLVALPISVWSGRLWDREESAKVTRDNGAASNAARVTKSLVARDALAKLGQIRDAAGKLHRTRTLPWLDTQETRWQVIARQASAVASKGIGAMPGVAERLLGHINAPDASDILERLTDFIDSRVAVDYSFSRPNRRFVHAGFYLPGTTVDGLEHLVFAVDTSGSIDAHMLRKCGEKLAGALESGKVQRITVLFADTHVRHVQTFERGDDIARDLRPRGGGGTGFSDTFRWIAANAPDATAAIYLTDMLCDDWGSEPDCPMLWAVHGTRAKADRLMKAAPFGDAVYIGLLE